MIPPRIRALSESFWVLPTLTALGALLLAEALLWVDRNAIGEGVWIFADLSPTGSRALLTTVGGSMLGVAATSFSITISVLATTSSTYGPRLVRNFMADRGNQLVLAILTSSFVYCLVVLRAVRSEGDGLELFVPTVAVHVAVLIALVDVAVLVYFIHHIATSVQVTSLQQRVGCELDVVVDLLYPEEPPRPETVRSAAALPRQRDDWHTVVSTGSGFVQQIDLDRLTRKACRADGVIEVLAPPGRHVIQGDPLARTSYDLDESARAAVCASFSLGPARTPHQDVAYAVQQLTEMAVRALSPGTNDPYTAIGALQTMTPGLVALSSRPRPAPGTSDEDGAVRVLLQPPSPATLVRAVLLGIRTWGNQDRIVVEAALDLADRVLRADPARGAGELGAAVHEEVEALLERYRATDPPAVDRRHVEDLVTLLPAR